MRGSERAPDQRMRLLQTIPLRSATGPGDLSRMHIYIYICMCLCLSVSVSICVCARARIHTHTHTDGSYTKGARAHAHRELIRVWLCEPIWSSLEFDPAFPMFLLQHGFDDSGRQFDVQMYIDTCICIDIPIHRRFIYKGDTSTRRGS